MTQTKDLVRCEGCPHGQAKIVGSRGREDSPFVIVAESPGVQEVKIGLPFVGPSGKVFEHALKTQHPDIFESDPLILNAFVCFPGTKTKDVKKVENATRICNKRLMTELQKHPRKVILALGNPAIWATTGNYTLKSTQVRGQLFKNPSIAEVGIVAGTHPAFILRGGGTMRQFKADVDYACRLLKNADTKKYVIPDFKVMESVEDIDWLADKVSQYEYCAADTETGGYSGFDFTRDRILCSGYCVEPDMVYVVPEELIKYTDRIYSKAVNTRFIWHNGKYDIKFHRQIGIPARVDEDTMLLSYALDETKGIHDLEQVSSDLLGAPDWKFMIKEYTVGKNKTYADIPAKILHDYMARDISATLQVFPILRNQVRLDSNLEKLYTKTLIPYSEYLTKIEMYGMYPDIEQVAKNQKEKTKLANTLEKWFNRIAIRSGFGALNLRSPIQVSAFLFDHLGLREVKRPKARPASTDEKTLTALQPHKAVKTLLRYREVQKGLSTYVNSVEACIAADGRIHSTYLIHGTTTGRLASREPNLLNIPRDPSLRSQFRAAPGKRLVEVDVSQAELRVLAIMSNDPVLIRIYNTPGMSIHKMTQHAMFGDPKEYSETQIAYYLDRFNVPTLERALEEQNMRAKTVNFGIVYGRTAPSIADEFGITVGEATAWIQAWFDKYRKAYEFIQQCRAAPARSQTLVTPFGRKRRFQVVSPEKLMDYQNQAANFPEQSIAADCVAHTGMLIQEEAREKYDAIIINTVYDSLLFELPDDDIITYELGTLVLSTLRKVPKMWGLTSVPFEGDLKVGKAWGDTKKTPLPPEYRAIVDAS